MSEADNRMEELADRVERADPGDWRALLTLAKDIYRELNELPALVTGGYGWREDDSGWWRQTGEDQRCPRKRIDPPNWFGSIDAAASLVPTKPFPELRPGTWWWSVDSLGCDAHVAYENHDSGIPEYQGSAATPASALTAACLRALADMPLLPRPIPTEAR